MILDRFERVVRAQFPLGKALSLDTKLKDLGADRVDVTVTVLNLEVEFGREYPPARWKKARTLGDLLQMVEELL